jgi:nuclear transcription factor Y gamma
MIAAEAPVLFAKACEMFILELTLRSWIHTEENKRRTLQRNDIAGAITRGDIFDFLVDIVPRDELKVRVYAAFDICCSEMARWLLTFNTRYCLVPRCLQ